MANDTSFLGLLNKGLNKVSAKLDNANEALQKHAAKRSIERAEKMKELQIDLDISIEKMKYSSNIDANTNKIIETKVKANHGDLNSQLELAIMYFEGKGVIEKSDELAFKWFLKAAEQGNAKAQAMCGYMYKNGIGVEQSDSNYFFWSAKAAEQGYVIK